MQRTLTSAPRECAENLHTLQPARRYNHPVRHIPPRASDSTLEAEWMQVDLLRAASVSRRFQLACSLSASVITAARRALLRADPRAEPLAADLRSVEIHDGLDLAAALAADLARRQPGRAVATP
jgi:hypothetical protein